MYTKLFILGLFAWVCLMVLNLDVKAKEYRQNSTFGNFSGGWATGATHYSNPVNVIDAKKKTVVIRGMTSYSGGAGAFLTTTTGAYTVECSNSLTSNTFVTCYDQNGTAATGLISRPWHFDDAVKYIRIKWEKATNWISAWMLYDNSEAY